MKYWIQRIGAEYEHQPDQWTLRVKGNGWQGELGTFSTKKDAELAGRQIAFEFDQVDWPSITWEQADWWNV